MNVLSELSGKEIEVLMLRSQIKLNKLKQDSTICFHHQKYFVTTDSFFDTGYTELKLGAQAHYQLMADLKTKIGSAKSFAVKKTAIVPSPWPWPSFA